MCLIKFSQTTASGCEGFATFLETTTSPFSGCVGNLVVTKQMTRL